MNLSGCNQTDYTRSIGGIILGAIVETRKKPSGDITRKIFSLSQDPSNFVRKNMCGTLRILFKLSGEYEDQVMEEIIKLVGDECIEVLEESLQLFIEILPLAKTKSFILESIEEYFVKYQFDKLTSIKLKFVGKIMQELEDVMDLNKKEAWGQWVLNMVELGGFSEKMSVSYSFGGILTCIKLDNKILRL